MQRKNEKSRPETLLHGSSTRTQKEEGSSKPEERRTIAKNVTLTLVVLSMVFYLIYVVYPIPMPPLPGASDRVLFTLRLQSFSCLTLIAGIAYVSLTRFMTTAVDPINGHGEHHVVLGVRYLTNTMEQLLVSVMGQLVLSSYLLEEQMKVVPILVLFFVTGRITFFLGYKHSYLSRSFGFATTAVPSLVVWVINIYFLVCELASI